MFNLLKNLFKRQPAAVTAPAQPQAAAKPQKQPVARAAAKQDSGDLLSMDDSDLRQDVRFDNKPLSAEQMRILDHAI